MDAVDDVARFVPTDDEAVVLASLMCPCCLCRPAQVVVTDLPEGADASCACARCALRWSVALDFEQAFRLFIAPPRGLWIKHRFRCNSDDD
jgi:hypothetical protein